MFPLFENSTKLNRVSFEGCYNLYMLSIHQYVVRTYIQTTFVGFPKTESSRFGYSTRHTFHLKKT